MWHVVCTSEQEVSYRPCTMNMNYEYDAHNQVDLLLQLQVIVCCVSLHCLVNGPLAFRFCKTCKANISSEILSNLSGIPHRALNCMRNPKLANYFCLHSEDMVDSFQRQQPQHLFCLKLILECNCYKLHEYVAGGLHRIFAKIRCDLLRGRPE